MSRSTFSILPYINRQKVKADGTANILCRITVDGKSAAISTGISCTPLCNTSKAITRATMSHPCRIAAKTLGTAFLPLDFLLLPTLRPLSLSQRMNHPRRERRNAEEALAFDASYKPFKQQKKYERRTIGSHLWYS